MSSAVVFSNAPSEEPTHACTECGYRCRPFLGQLPHPIAPRHKERRVGPRGANRRQRYGEYATKQWCAGRDLEPLESP